MDSKLQSLAQTFGTHRIKFNEPMADHVLSKLGGPAEAFFIATNQNELTEILNAVHELQIPYFIFGSGTKTFVSPNGLKGLVIKNRTSGLKIGAVKGKVGREGIGVEEAMVEIDSGVSLGKLNEFLAAQNLQLIHDVSNYATLGGSIWFVPHLLERVQKLNIWDKGQVYEVTPDELNRTNHIVLSAILKIKAA
jgi:FAD/FMN-containing dehydrogenase